MTREPEDPRRICPVRVALQNQRDHLLAFAGLLDAELAAIARAHAVPEPLVREAYMLHRLPTTSPAYWQSWRSYARGWEASSTSSLAPCTGPWSARRAAAPSWRTST